MSLDVNDRVNLQVCRCKSNKRFKWCLTVAQHRSLVWLGVNLEGRFVFGSSRPIAEKNRLRLGVTLKSVTLGNVTMSHRTREAAECLASLSHSTMIGLRAQH
ncbi:hypothetical protein EVAR_45099_1 [Eumeta japonica]|uniref:Uncharacterized protein n=1 Tax=Eumeta variegata TaxID=151549 RepID=A0A4C1YI81_EUMVA|nr:hypothetical protein EVAR_45099_1 [Eumeta japonica]